MSKKRHLSIFKIWQPCALCSALQPRFLLGEYRHTYRARWIPSGYRSAHAGACSNSKNRQVQWNARVCHTVTLSVGENYHSVQLRESLTTRWPPQRFHDIKILAIYWRLVNIASYGLLIAYTQLLKRRFEEPQVFNFKLYCVGRKSFD